MLQTRFLFHGRRDAHPGLDAFRQAGVVGDLDPGVTTIGGLVKAGIRPAVAKAPRIASHFPERRVERIRILGVHAEIDGPGFLAAEQHLLPTLAPVL